MTSTGQAAGAVTMTVEDGIALVRLDQPGKPVNVLSSALVEEMAGVIGRLESGEAKAAVLLSGKPGVWIAGADIDELKELESAEDGTRLSATAHELLGRLERLPVPVVAAIDGVALGGGLEVALACSYRLATDSPKTKLGLPEVQLGLLPGAGGTQRLPRLIGLRTALDLILTGRQLDARRAKKAGIVDEVVPAAALERVALQTARDLAAGRKHPTVARRRGSPQWAENLPGVRGFIFKKAREGVMKQTHGLYPAPLRILQVVGRGIDLPLQKGLELEAKAFGDLSATPEAHALTHVFFASTGAKNDPEIPEGAEPHAVERVAVVGAGFMGAGIAVVSAENGLRVRLKDVSAEAVAKGVATATASIVKRAKKRRRKPYEITALTDQLEGTAEYTGFGSADVVVEAVFEDVDLKHRVLREIDQAAGDDAVLGSNTSTIPITDLATAVEHPERVIGLHFFSPVEKMPLLEIIVTERTAPWVTATSHRYAKRIGKTPIIVNDAPGFYVNRILAPYMNEAALLLQEGASIEEIDRAMVQWGFPVGPITLYDEVGLDVALHSGEIMQKAFGDRIPGNDVLQTLVDDGRLGRKNGRGFYTYEDGKKVAPDASVYPLIGAPARRSIPRAEIQERLALGMVAEAVRCLEDDVLRSARDGDVGAVFGIGFPPFRGGPFWFVDSTGPAEIARRLRVLESAHGPRFAPPASLMDGE
ncbi:MAG TPA: 3-hydroxyacyl-CoA dehydrogenase NAD-binding domain-containing protein [Longimicrobiaceae bacterium]|nr:3-hydroxyacyl-CoA dehydrogenase NAD-binding domain-containing protein [Longimicrobiaceae bacterium]